MIFRLLVPWREATLLESRGSDAVMGISNLVVSRFSWFRITRVVIFRSRVPWCEATLLESRGSDYMYIYIHDISCVYICIYIYIHTYIISIYIYIYMVCCVDLLVVVYAAARNPSGCPWCVA